MAINFYKTKEPFGEFSNFYPRSIVYRSINFKTSEHAFQVSKRWIDRIPDVPHLFMSAREIADWGRDKSIPIRPDWEDVKIHIMQEILFCKFSQHEDLRKLLISTGKEDLVEHTENDSFWGDGGDGSGKNMLGILLETVRSCLT